MNSYKDLPEIMKHHQSNITHQIENGVVAVLNPQDKMWSVYFLSRDDGMYHLGMTTFTISLLEKEK